MKKITLLVIGSLFMFSAKTLLSQPIFTKPAKATKAPATVETTNENKLSSEPRKTVLKPNRESKFTKAEYFFRVRLFGSYLLPLQQAYTSSTYDSFCERKQGTCYQTNHNLALGLEILFGKSLEVGLNAQYLFLGQTLGESDSATVLSEINQFVPIMLHAGYRFNWFRLGVGAGYAVNITQAYADESLSKDYGMAMAFQTLAGFTYPISRKVAIELSGRALFLRQEVKVSDGLSTRTKTRMYMYVSPTLAVSLAF